MFDTFFIGSHCNVEVRDKKGNLIGNISGVLEGVAIDGSYVEGYVSASLSLSCVEFKIVDVAPTRVVSRVVRSRGVNAKGGKE